MAPNLSKLQLNNINLTGAMGGSGNPFGNTAMGIGNEILQGGNVYDALGNGAVNLGKNMLSLAANSLFGGITSGISSAVEEAKNKKNEAKIAKEQQAAEQAAKDGAAKTEETINEANANVANYQAEIDKQREIIKENKDLVEGEKEKLLKDVTLMQTQLDNYNKAKKEKDELQAQYDNETDEAKKAELEKQLNAKNTELGIYAATLNSIQPSLKESSNAIAEAIKKTGEAKEVVTDTQEQIYEEIPATQATVDEITTQTGNEVTTHLSDATKTTSTLASDGSNQVQQGLVPVGQSAIQGAGGAGVKTAGIITGYVGNFNAANSALGALNTTIDDTFEASANITAQADATIEETENFNKEVETPEWKPEEK